MRTHFAVLLMLAPASALGGTVRFDPPQLLLTSGEPAVFQVSVVETGLESFDSISLLFDVDQFPNASFTYAPSFLSSVTVPPAPGSPFCFGPWCGLVAGGTRFAAPYWQAPLLIGELTIDMQGVHMGEYEVIVSASAEEELLGLAMSVAINGQTVEPLEGRAKIYTGVPEPAALVLLVTGLGTIWRSRLRILPR